MDRTLHALPVAEVSSTRHQRILDIQRRASGRNGIAELRQALADLCALMLEDDHE